MKDNRYEWCRYSLVMYNVSSMQKGVQTTHSCLGYAREYGSDNDFEKYVDEDCTLIILDGGTSSDIFSIEKELVVENIKHSFFIEPDLNNSMTSVCFLADERVWDRKNYPDYEGWASTIKGVEISMLLTYPPQIKKDERLYEEWVNFIGGEKNVFLRELIKNKRLSM